METTIQQSKTSQYDEELIQRFITTRVCQHSKKIQKDSKRITKNYSIMDDNSATLILSKCGKLASAHEIICDDNNNKKTNSIELTKAQIREQFNFDIDAQLTDEDFEIPDDHIISVQHGKDFDLH